MPTSPQVSKILSHYESDNPGSKANLARILNQGKLAGTGKVVILPVDQGFEHGPARSFAANPAGYDPHYHHALAIEAGLSAYAAPLGPLEASSGTFAGQIPTILKCNSSNSLATSKDQAVTGTVADALRLGCSAIGFTIYPGSEYAFAQMEELRDLSEKAKAAGLAVVTWSYPRGPELDKAAETAIDICAYAAHMAALLGAHIIKVKPPTDVLSLPAAKKVYLEQKIDVSTMAKRVQHVVQGLLQRPPHGGVLRRRERQHRDAAGGRAGPRRRRRQRLDHGPQHLPARQAGRAGAAGLDRRDLPEGSVRPGALPLDPARAGGPRTLRLRIGVQRLRLWWVQGRHA